MGAAALGLGAELLTVQCRAPSAVALRQALGPSRQAMRGADKPSTQGRRAALDHTPPQGLPRLETRDGFVLTLSD